MNAAGEVAFLADLSDGTRGLFLALPAAPPVPSLASPALVVLASLVAGAGVAVQRRRRTP